MGVVLGSYFSQPPLGFYDACALMAFIAVYDYVAVFITRHMIALGREAVNRNLSFMIGSYDVEVVPKSYLKKSEIGAMKKSMAESKAQSPELKKLIKEGNYPVPSFSALGTGDLAMPLMLAVSAYLTYMQYFMSILIIAGGACGLVFAMYVSKKYKIALPAIPPLLAFISIALGADVGILGLNFYLMLLGVSLTMLGLMLFSARGRARRATRQGYLRFLPRRRLRFPRTSRTSCPCQAPRADLLGPHPEALRDDHLPVPPQMWQTCS